MSANMNRSEKRMISGTFAYRRLTKPEKRALELWSAIYRNMMRIARKMMIPIRPDRSAWVAEWYGFPGIDIRSPVISLKG